MERSVVLAYKGYLVYVHQSETGLELEYFRFRSSSDFYAELVSKAAVTSKLFLEIEDVRNIVDDRNGVEAPVILASCDGKSNSEKRFRVIQTKWNGSSAIRHRRHIDINNTDSDTGANAPSKCSKSKSCVQLVSYMEFSCNSLHSKSECGILVYGPRVLVACQNRLLLFGVESNVKDMNCVQRKEFFICDADGTRETAVYSGATGTNHVNEIDAVDQPESKIVSVVSEEKWIVAVLQVQKKCSTSLVAVAIEKNSYTGEFKKNMLKIRDFLPHEYAPKVTSLSINRCQKTGTVNGVGTYKIVCTIGLNDGYVLTFSEGIMQTCITLWTYIDAVYPAFAVTDVVKFSSDILICHSDTKHCFIFNETTKQVIHHWNDVDKAVVGDFLHCGGQQLLLLFDSNTCVPPQCPENYLLTDLQGLVVDRRKDEDTSSSQKNFQAQDGETSRNLQPVVNALREQNQTLARRVAEEKQRLTCKQVFMAETWKHLLALSLHGAEAMSDVCSPPEVPLVGLVGGDRCVKPLDKRRSVKVPACKDIQVIRVWHRLLDDVCVIGVKILNVSDRELFNCSLVLLASSSSSSPPVIQPTHNQQLSATTRVWQCLHTDSPSSSVSEPSPSKRPSKRHKMHPQLQVRQTRVIQPSESVILTGTLGVPDVGWCGDVTYHVDVMYAIKAQKSCVVSNSQLNRGSVAVSCTGIMQKDVVQGDVTCGTGRSQCAEKQDTELKPLKDRDKTKNASCGDVVLKVSELLGQNKALSNLFQSQENSQGVQLDWQFEEDLLALNSVQQQWLCDISFVLHEAVDIIPNSLHSAGFIFSPALGQYLISSAASKCLHFVRAQFSGVRPHPRRAASIIVFARDTNQFLLVLRHMYAHLPEDATITLAREHQSPDIQHVAKAMSAELSERKKQARVVLDGQKQSLRQSGNAALEQTTEEKNKDSMNSKSAPGAKSESEEFGDWQKLYRQNQTSFVGREDVAKFRAAMRDSEAETHTAVAKLKL